MRFQMMLFAIVITASLAVASPSFAVEKTETTPQQFIGQWVATFNKNDSELLLPFYDQSDDLEVIISAGVRHHGYEAVRKAFADDFKSVRFYDSKASDTATRILGDTAIVTFTHTFKAHLREDNTRWQIQVRTTSVLHRMQGEWKIVLEHSSPIQGIDRYTQIQE